MASKRPDNRVRVEPTITLGDAKENGGAFSANHDYPDSKYNAPRKMQDRKPLPVTNSAEIRVGVPAGVFAAVVVLFLTIVVGGGWFFYQQLGLLQNDLVVSKYALKESSSQLGALESRISTTDKSINLSGNETTQTLEMLDSEVRKLWAIANKRNKNAIAANKKIAASLGDELDKVKATTSAYKKQIEGVETANASLLKKTEGQAWLAKTQADSVKAQEVKIKKLIATISILERQIATQNTQLASVKSEVGKLSNTDEITGKVEINSQDIESINAYRRQSNSSIDKLNQDIRILYQRIGPLGVVQGPGL